MKGYRKVGFAVYLETLAFVALMTKYLSGAEYVSIAGTIAIAFLAANSSQAILEKVTAKFQITPKTETTTTVTSDKVKVETG